jgi:hypothetical protein
MRFADVDGQEIGVILVVGVELRDVANLATEWRSSETAEDQHQRPPCGSFANVKPRGAIEGDQPCVRRRIAHFQFPAAHVWQCVAHHVHSVFGAAGHPTQQSEDADEKNAEEQQCPFQSERHRSLRSTVRGEQVVAQCFIAQQSFFDNGEGGVGRANVLDLHLLAFQLLVILKKAFHNL